MENKEFILRSVVVDNNKNNCIWNYGHKVPLTINFDQNKEIDKAALYEDHETGQIRADLFVKDVSLLKGYLAIGGIIKERNGKEITRFDITSVGICSNQNQDESIKKIEEQ